MKKLYTWALMFTVALFAWGCDRNADTSSGFIDLISTADASDHREPPHAGENCGGGCQVNRPDLSPIQYELPDGEICYFLAPAGIDFEDCQLSNSSPTSAFTVITCGDLTADLVCEIPPDD